MTATPTSPLIVVCPLTDRPNSGRALPSAVDASVRLGGSLELFSAVEDPHMVERQRAYLGQVSSEHCDTQIASPNIEVVVEPHAPEALVKRALSNDVVMVMATSSQPLMHAGYLGSAAERVVRQAHNPAILIGPHNQTRLGDIERVVVPCDGSQLSEAVLPDARDWADRLGLDLWIVTSLSPSDTRQRGYDADSEANYVRRLAERVGAQFDVLHGSNPARTIVDWSGPALLAMTTHGRSGLSRITVGSVTAAVTRWATGPVLVKNCQRSPGLESGPD